MALAHPLPYRRPRRSVRFSRAAPSPARAFWTSFRLAFSLPALLLHGLRNVFFGVPWRRAMDQRDVNKIIRLAKKLFPKVLRHVEALFWVS